MYSVFSGLYEAKQLSVGIRDPMFSSAHIKCVFSGLQEAKQELVGIREPMFSSAHTKCVFSGLQEAKQELVGIREKQAEIDVLSRKLAAHFCESESSFKLEEFLSIMTVFCEKVKHCQKVGI